jgi:hypothetical protein
LGSINRGQAYRESDAACHSGHATAKIRIEKLWSGDL